MDEVTLLRLPLNVIRSLGFRLTVWNTVVVLSAALAALVAVREAVRFTIQLEHDGILKEETAEIGLAIKQYHPDFQEIERELQRKAESHAEHDWFVQWFDVNGQLLWTSRNTPPTWQRPPQDERSPIVLLESDAYRVAERRIRSENVPTYVVRIGAPTAFIADDVNRMTRLILPIGLVMSILAPLGGYLLARRATGPLKRIISTTERLRPTQLEERLPLRGTGDELDQLSQRINLFLDQIGSYVRNNREFVGNAAHELRSPLAAIRSSVEVALSKERSTEEYEDLLISVNDECNRLRVLVNQLLLLAENDGVAKERTRLPVELHQVIQDAVRMFEGVAEDRGIALFAQLDSPIVVRGDRDQLRQVITNLLDNALKFTPAGGNVQVILRRDSDRGTARLTIDDSGIGIPGEDRERVFDRFYQVDPARQRDVPDHGNGLGLSICQSVVIAHGGSISIDVSPLPTQQNAILSDSAVRRDLGDHLAASSEIESHGTRVIVELPLMSALIASKRSSS